MGRGTRDGGGGVADAGGIDVPEGHGGARCSGALRDGQPDAARAAGHHRYAAIHVDQVHATPL